MDEICTWAEDEDADGSWFASCGGSWVFNDGNPDDNDMKFCCFCGLPLKAVAYMDVDDSIYIGEN